MILVVGETARAESFSLNGYAKNTNPELSKQDIFNFSQVSSCGTATAVSVPCMFSGMPRVDYDEQLASHREGLLDIAKRAGYQVLGLIITRVVKVHVIALTIPDSRKLKEKMV
ncbi:phosphoethanolamine transferase EptA family protein [Acinetobacter baumannii IS-143]|nr:phosphoethanolamine transferase EptA family protein [Acinetobacter baumannii IS-143]